MADLTGKVAIITGCSSGIGLATTQTLLAAGCQVLGVDITPSTHEYPSDQKARFTFHQADLTQPDAPRSIVQACSQAYGGRINILLNVAGIMDTFQSADTVDDLTWDRTLAINLTAPEKLMREVLQVMKSQGSGSIVNVSSRAGLGGGVAGIAYTSAKTGLIGATKHVAWRFRHEGIRCNAICPGAVATNIFASADHSKIDTVSLEELKPVNDLHIRDHAKIMGPEHIANLLLFLSSDLSLHINGTVIPIDDAWSAA